MEFNLGLLLGGFGLFMFGMKYMGDGLKSYCGNSLRELVDKYTTNPFLGLIIGTVVTCIIQSSSATSVIVIGFVRAGLMKLEQAAGVLIGAALGTTITSFLIGLKVEKFALYFIFIGGLMVAFSNKKKTIYLGEIVLGFGTLFYGLKIMGDTLVTLVNTQYFISFTELTSKSPFIAFIIGLITTVLLQSSSVSIGIIQKIYEAGGISYIGATFFVFAANIGTTITGALAALGGSKSAKRTALLNTLIKSFYIVIALSFSKILIDISLHFSMVFGLDKMMEISFIHIITNIIGVLITFPLIDLLVRITKRFIPIEENATVEFNVKKIDENLAQTHPYVALEFTQKQIYSFKDMVISNVLNTQKYLNNSKNNQELKEVIISAESRIDDADGAISNNLRVISKTQLSEIDMSEYNLQSSIIKSYERIADLAINLVEFYEMVFDDKNNFSNEAIEEINMMYGIFKEMFEYTSKIYFDKEIKYFEKLNTLENKLDNTEYEVRMNHFRRISNDSCSSIVASSVYCDIIGTIERMGDHCMNISRYCLSELVDSKF